MGKKLKRPSWNPAVKVQVTMTLCLRNAIDDATKTLAFMNRQEFIIDTLRKRLDELGIKHIMER